MKPFDGWKEDLGSITSYHQLPKRQDLLAQNGRKSDQGSYPEGHGDSKLPQIRFIGVGPDPGQIISRRPTTEKLMAEELHSFRFLKDVNPPALPYSIQEENFLEELDESFISTQLRLCLIEETGQVEVPSGNGRHLERMQHIG